MRGLAVAALLAGLGCGRIAFDPLGSGGGVDEENVVQRPIVGAGRQFSCVRRGDGSVWCWGDGRRGQLGNDVEAPRVAPARVAGLPAVVALDVGLDQACAMTQDGDVWCWGDNDYGQVDGTSGDSEKPPTRVPLPRPAATVSAGGYHTCAILDDQSLSCWGKNSDGQIGKGAVSGEHVLQHAVLDRVTAISAGVSHTCAVRDGTVSCWGKNDAGQVGDGTDMPVTAPTSLGIAATSVSAGAYHTCALDAGRYRCWGDNGDGQLGIAGDSTNTPAPASSLGGFVALRTGGSHTCALRDDESLWCWGNNTTGTLGNGAGDGTSSRSTAPIQVATTGADVAAGWDHTCAADTDGVVTCWGAGRFGAVGDPLRTAALRPKEVSLPAAANAIFAGSRFACALLDPDQSLYCWGQNGSGQLAIVAGGAQGAPQNTGFVGLDYVSLGENHGCGSFGGTLNCWGDNSHGQLGDGTTTSRSTPMPTASNVNDIAVGYEFSCGLSGGDVYCWGSPDRGRLGIGTVDQLTPIMNGSTATNLDLGVAHVCALNGTSASCWGWNEAGQLGRGTTSLMETAGAVSGSTAFNTLTTGAEHTCGSTAGGELYCWGINNYGMLGTGDGDARTTPTSIVASGGREIAARQYHTCAEINGAANCWGYNDYGQIGDGTADTAYAPTPVVDIPAGVVMFALGNEFTCVLSADSKVRCWGDNTFGQLGIGDVGFAASPYTVALP